MTKTIIVRITKNYGREAIYPACDTGENFLRLTGRRTFTRHDISVIKNMGYAVKVQQETLA